MKKILRNNFVLSFFILFLFITAAGAINGPAVSPMSSAIFGTAVTSEIQQISVGLGGQSLNEYKMTRGSPRHGNIYAEALKTEFGFSGGTVTWYTDGADNYVSTDASSKQATDYTARVVNFASGGSSLVGRNVNAAAENYWWNIEDNTAVTGNPLDEIDTPGPLLRQAVSDMATYSIDAFDWSQGETDAIYVTGGATERATYKATLKKVFNYVRTQTGKSTLPVFISRIGRGNKASNTGFQVLKEVQYEVAAEDDYTVIGAEQYIANYAIIDTFASCTVTSGSATVSCSDTGGASANEIISGTGIPDNSYVVSVVTNTSITLNNTATASGTVDLYHHDDTHYYAGSDGVEPLTESGNTEHDTTLGFYAISKRAAHNIARYFNEGEQDIYGPYISAVAATVGESTIALTITNDEGTNLTTENGAISSASTIQFRVENNSSAMTITDVSYASDTITLTVSGTIASGTLEVWSGYGAMNRTWWGDLIRDNASVSMPLQQQDPTNWPALSITPTVPAYADIDDIAEVDFYGKTTDAGSITKSGDDVTAWADQTVSGNDAANSSPSTGPRSDIRTLNSVNAFDWGADAMEITGYTLTGGTAFSGGLAVNFDTVSGTDYIFDNTDGSQGAGLRRNGTELELFFFTNIGTELHSTSSLALSTGVTYIVCFRVESGSIQLHVDGTAEINDTSTYTTITDTSTALHLGADYLNGSQLNGLTGSFWFSSDTYIPDADYNNACGTLATDFGGTWSDI